MVEKAVKSEELVLGLAGPEDIGAALRAARIMLSSQDAELKYIAALNPSFLFEANAAFIGQSDRDLFPAAASESLVACKRRVAESGKGESLDLALSRDDRTRWFRLFVEPLSPNGARHGVLSTCIEVTEEKAAEEHLRLALLELAHRSKNLLAVVLSIARQSADESQTLAQFGSRFVGRIQSLALAHDVLTDESWRGATVFNLVRSQLSAFSGTAVEQSTISGHNAYLKPNAVQYVGLALHELIALSVVSGALSAPDGHIDFTTALVGGEGDVRADLVLMWRETGSAVTSGEKSLFGHALLERIVPAALSGQASLTAPAPNTLAYELRIPSSQFF
jgi:two-component sensor histidine kinase